MVLSLMTSRRYKHLFWIFVATTLTLMTIPSITLLKGWKSTRRFLTGFEPGVIRQTRVHHVPDRTEDRLDWEPRLRFIEFSISAPKARAVSLTGDFAGWKEEGLPMTLQEDGRWQVIVPLPTGRYRYLFIVDGKRVADPSHPPQKDPSGSEGAQASLKVVR